MGSLKWLLPVFPALILANGVKAANSTATTTSVAAQRTSLNITVDDLWNIYVGPVGTASLTTTLLTPTPIPSSELIPPPPLHYPSYLKGQDFIAVTKNASWSFPKGFWWGVSSASYQVEGAVKDEGRGPTIWDVYTHRAQNIADNQTGDVAINEYYTYRREIQRIAAMGVQVYSFSIAWSRIFPFGNGQINEAGLKHYDDVIDTCIQYGIKPYVTLYHWDLPVYLELAYGGWTSPNIVDDYLAYAEVLFKRWGSKVPAWFTFNEPLSFCGEYPNSPGYFPTLSIPSVQQKYWCERHMLLANGKAYKLARSLNITAPISVKFNGGWKLPLTNSSADAEAVQRAWAYQEGSFADPLFLTGDFPARLKNFTSTFLPEFTSEEKAMIKGSADIFAHDAYTSKYYMAPDTGIEACLTNSSHSLFPLCFNNTVSLPASEGGWLIGPAADPNSAWEHKATEYVPALLHYLQDHYNPPQGIAISEFGITQPFEYYKTSRADILMDQQRIDYYLDYMNALLIAVDEGVKLVGALAWAACDNLEWTAGFTVKYGLQYVNLTTQERYYKASFFHLAKLFKEYAYEE